MPSKTLSTLAQQEGIAERTLTRACDDLGVRREKRGTAWFSSLPQEESADGKIANAANGGSHRPLAELADMADRTALDSDTAEES